MLMGHVINKMVAVSQMWRVTPRNSHLNRENGILLTWEFMPQRLIVAVFYQQFFTITHN